MYQTRCLGRVPLVLLALFLLICFLVTIAHAQDIPQLSSPGIPPNAYGSPGSSEAIPVSSGILAPFLPRIPNLELGFLYSFGKNVRTGRFTADYVLPFKLNCDSVLFGEAHAEGWDFWKRPNVSITTPAGFTTTTSTSRSRVDLSFGGGYRTMIGDGMMLGANGFYDASRLFNKWYSSGGVGLEMAATVGGDDAVDVNFNWYGNLFNRDVLVNAFRNKGNSFDVEAGYSHALFDHAIDLRLKLVGYQLDAGTTTRGWRGGADLTTRDGMFTLRYEHGQDPINGAYNTVGGVVTVGFQLENLLSGASPFTMPEPVFRSPRDLRRLLGLKVKRNWHQPSAVVVARSSAVDCGDTTRFFDTLPFVKNIHGDFQIPGLAYEPFPQGPVPFFCLSPAGNVVVSFHYDLNGFSPSTYLAFTVRVMSSDGTVSLDTGVLITVPLPIPSSGDVGPVILNNPFGSPFPNQNAFVSTQTDIWNFTLSAVTVDQANQCDITNVQILFNQ